MKRTGITNKPSKPGRVSSTAITSQPGRLGGAIDAAGVDTQRRPSLRNQPHPLWRALEIAASLRITVVLFVLSIILVYFGTWAQKDQGIWTVVDQYFRSAYVLIPLHVILMFAIEPVNIYIPYPGGWLLGGLLLGNLLAAHIVRFKLSWKRSGILLIHAGLIIMMLGELITGLYQVEGRMRIGQGQSVNYVQLDRVAELAVMDRSNPKYEEVVSVPTGHLRTGEYVSHSDLPFDIEVNEYMVNSSLARREKDDPAVQEFQGHGRFRTAIAEKEISGTDPNQTIDYPSAYLTLYDKKTHERIGKYLVSYNFLERPGFDDPQPVRVDGKEYLIELRPKREYRDFHIKLLKFDFDRYPGTNTPKNYQSDVILIDPKNKENRRVTISMNNPLRYQGETFYQASFFGGETGTILQVVRNPGWLMPYISCVVVTLGMLIHFGLNLISFLQRRAAQ